MKRVIVCAALAACAHTLCLAQGDPWPMFRFNPARTGRSEWGGCATGQLSWSYLTGHTVESPPVVGSDGTAYFGSYDERVHAVAPPGALSWSYELGDYVAPALALDRSSGHVYAVSYDNRLTAFTFAGALAWTYETGGNITGSSPAVDSAGRVYVGSWDNRLHVVSSAGGLEWSYATAGDVHSSPSVADGRVHVGSEDGRLYSFSAAGALAWSYASAGRILESSPAVGSDGTLYIGESGPSATPVPCNLYAVSSAGALVWSYATGSHLPSSPSIGWGEEIVVGSGDRNVYVFNPSGTLWWSYETGGYVHSSPAVDADGMIFVGSIDHGVYALGSMGNLAWTYATGGPVMSSPAIGFSGTVYVGSFDNALYVFGATPVPTLTPTPAATPEPTPLFNLWVSSNSPSAGDSFTALAVVRPLAETFDAYGVVLGEGGPWSFDLANRGALVPGVRPLARAVPGLGETWMGRIFSLNAIPHGLRGMRFTIVAGLVPAGMTPSMESAIPGYLDQEAVEIR